MDPNPTVMIRHLVPVPLGSPKCVYFLRSATQMPLYRGWILILRSTLLYVYDTSVANYTSVLAWHVCNVLHLCNVWHVCNVLHFCNWIPPSAGWFKIIFSCGLAVACATSVVHYTSVCIWHSCNVSHFFIFVSLVQCSTLLHCMTLALNFPKERYTNGLSIGGGS